MRMIPSEGSLTNSGDELAQPEAASATSPDPVLSTEPLFKFC